MKNNRYSWSRACLPIVGIVFSGSMQLFAQTNSENKNAPPKLMPPYGELPPTFWEQHASSLVFACLGVIVLIALGLFIIFRSKPKIIIPPEIQARETLQELRLQPETGMILSRVSQTIRSYFSKAFQLSPGEHTTTEFCREISNKEDIGGELSNAVAGFLRDCDTHKFSSTAGSVKLDAANRALSLVEQAEQRRVQLRQPAEIQVQGRDA